MASLVCATAASVSLLVVPVYEGACIGVAVYGPGGTSCPAGVSHTTLLDENGPHVLWLLALPVVLAAIGAASRGRRARVVAAAGLGAFALVTGFSVGAAYLPAALGMAIAATGRPAGRPTRPRRRLQRPSRV